MAIVQPLYGSWPKVLSCWRFTGHKISTTFFILFLGMYFVGARKAVPGCWVTDWQYYRKRTGNLMGLANDFLTLNG